MYRKLSEEESERLERYGYLPTGIRRGHGGKLLEHLKKRGITQKQIADATGYTQPTISGWKTKTNTVRGREAAAIIELFAKERFEHLPEDMRPRSAAVDLRDYFTVDEYIGTAWELPTRSCERFDLIIEFAKPLVHDNNLKELDAILDAIELGLFSGGHREEFEELREKREAERKNSIMF